MATNGGYCDKFRMTRKHETLYVLLVINSEDFSLLLEVCSSVTLLNLYLFYVLQDSIS